MSEERKGLSAKEYLGQLEIIDTKIQQKLEELDALKMKACSTGSIDYSKERVQTSRSGDAIGNAVVRYTSLNNEINREIDEFADVRHRVIKEIQSLNDAKYIKVLFKVYVQYKNLRTAATEMELSYEYVRGIHNKALAAFENKYSNLRYLT